MPCANPNGLRFSAGAADAAPPRSHPTRLEAGVEVRVHPPALLRMDAARHVEPHEAVHDRRPHADARRRLADVAPLRSIARPADVPEHARPHDTDAVCEPGPRHPEPIPCGDTRTLTAN